MRIGYKSRVFGGRVSAAEFSCVRAIHLLYAMARVEGVCERARRKDRGGYAHLRRARLGGRVVAAAEFSAHGRFEARMRGGRSARRVFQNGAALGQSALRLAEDAKGRVFVVVGTVPPLLRAVRYRAH